MEIIGIFVVAVVGCVLAFVGAICAWYSLLTHTSIRHSFIPLLLGVAMIYTAVQYLPIHIQVKIL